MGWIIGIVALGLAMTVLTIGELRRPAATNASASALRLGDRVIGIFIVVTSTIAFVQGVILLAGKILP